MADRIQSEAGLLPVSGDVFTGCFHPAGAAAIRHFSIGLQAEKYTWPGSPLLLRTAAVMPTSSGHFSTLVQYIGYGGLVTLQAGIGYARPLADWCKVGVRFSYYRSGIRGYGSVSAFPVDLGTVVRLNEKLSSDLACWNIFSALLPYQKSYRMPRVIRSGLSYMLSEAAGMSISALAEEHKQISAQVSVYYRFHPQFSALLSFATAYQGITLFVYYTSKRLRISLGFAYAFPIGMLGMPGVQYTNLQTESP